MRGRASPNRGMPPIFRGPDARHGSPLVTCDRCTSTSLGRRLCRPRHRGFCLKPRRFGAAVPWRCRIRRGKRVLSARETPRRHASFPAISCRSPRRESGRRPDRQPQIDAARRLGAARPRRLYAWLPLCHRCCADRAIVREEQDKAGAVEMLMPTLQSADLWRQSGRYEAYGPEMLRIHRPPQPRHDSTGRPTRR